MDKIALRAVGDQKGLATETATVMVTALEGVMARAAVKKDIKENFAWTALTATTALSEMKRILFVQIVILHVKHVLVQLMQTVRTVKKAGLGMKTPVWMWMSVPWKNPPARLTNIV